jgi:uncharacterized metal-binding protein YceD (DUF177 family)
MTPSDVPFSAPFDLGLVPAQDSEIVLAPTEAERASISEWLGIEGLESLKAVIVISRKGENQYACSATFEADVVQACVVTLEPVRAHLSGGYQRLYRVRPRASTKRRKPIEEPKGIDIAVFGEDEPELLAGPIVDLAAPLLEEISLALDPYPRAPGVTFAPPAEEEDAADNPFAVLERLKTAKTSPPGRVKDESGTKPATPGKK